MDRCGDPEMRELAFTLSHVALWPCGPVALWPCGLGAIYATINSQTFFDAQFEVNCPCRQKSFSFIKVTVTS
jgi:hypothetical protein